ncbi:MAG: N-acetylmuramoyl-L-alanine amidase [Alphaproteobacteria bacterium]|nr:N-acetylmuramoyl-L-alanine amidase [Alphaproteobacteria bacterium]
MNVESRPSPNQDDRPAGVVVDMLVLHYTGMRTAEEALARLTHAASKVSAHYTIARDGKVYAHVPEGRCAWHAGLSFWSGRPGVNARSIGIELINPGHEFGYVPFAEPQIQVLMALAKEICVRHAIPRANVVGHSDVAPMRKTDPGELFPWQRLAGEGIGLWPGMGGTRETRVNLLSNPAAGLARFGYGLPPHSDHRLDHVVAAFQRHFRPTKVDFRWDYECAERLASLLGQLP